MKLNDADYNYVQTLVQKRSAIVLEDGKRYLAESRLLPIVRREGLSSLSDLISHLRSNPRNGLHQKVVEAMTTNETSFFRDLNPYEALRKVIIPNLMKSRDQQRRFRVWCAASSTGQEPYSLAMLIREHFPQLRNWDVQILATDLSSDVLEKAREGIYGQIEVNRGLPAAMLVKYFQRVGTHWQVKAEIRELVEYRQMNLIEPWAAPKHADIVLIRNVLIYFDVPTKKDILARTRRVLAPDGYLFLGGAESTLNLDDAYERVEVERTSVYRLKQR